MAISRRNFVRAAGMGSLGVVAAPWRSAMAGENLRWVFRREGMVDPDKIHLGNNENPVGPGKAVLDALENALPTVSRYPFQPVGQFRQTLIRYLSLPEQDAGPGEAFGPHKNSSLLVGVGSTEILRACLNTFTATDRPLVIGLPSYDDPVTYCAAIKTPVRTVAVDANLRLDLTAMLEQVQGAGMLYICNPNNPTATVHSASDVNELIKQVNARAPNCMIVVDEAYRDYADDPDQKTVLPTAIVNPNVVVLRTFSKAFGMAGLRLGYAVGHPDTIARLQPRMLFIGQNVMAMVAGTAGLEAASPHIAQESKRNRDAREFTRNAFEGMGFKSEPSSTNFIFVPIKREASAFAAACARQGVLVGRSFPPLTTYSRISIGTMDEMQKAVEVFKSTLATV